jgi:Leucine-rich repeat (LRR) protein
MSDREFLVELFRTTKGKFWIRKDNWLSGENCRKWFGVSVNSSGHVHILNLRRNYLQERIDLIVSWRVLSNIQVLCLSENSIQGEIPSRLGDLHSLEELDLSWNEFVGTIPAEIFHLPKLKVLRLEHNRLHGELSIELSNCKRLQFLNLSMNEFSGIVFVLLHPYNIIVKVL